MYTNEEKKSMSKQNFVFMRAQFNSKKQHWNIAKMDPNTLGWKVILPATPYQNKQLAIVEIQKQQRTNSKIVIDN